MNDVLEVSKAELESLYREKGEILTTSEILQQRLTQVNKRIYEILQGRQKNGKLTQSVDAETFKR